MRILLAAAPSLLTGCAAFNYRATDSPVAQAKPMLISPAPRISVVLGSGVPLTLFDINPFADRGLIQDQRLQDFVNRELGDKPIERLGMPFIAVATQRVSKSRVLFLSRILAWPYAPLAPCRG